MPMYLYAVVLADGGEGETFEVLQGMNDEPLSVHPHTGAPVRRLLSAPNVRRKPNVNPGSADLSDKNLEKLGFTKYKKSSDGQYEKTAGAGPDSISK